MMMPIPNMPEKTTPITVSCLIRLLWLRYPVNIAQDIPAAKAPTIRGNPVIHASTTPGNTA